MAPLRDRDAAPAVMPGRLAMGPLRASDAKYALAIAYLSIRLVPCIIDSLDDAEAAACIVFGYLNGVLFILAFRRLDLSEPGSVEESRARLAGILHLLAALLALCWMNPFLILSWPLIALILGWFYKKGAFE